MKKVTLFSTMILTLSVIILSVVQYNKTSNLDFIIVGVLFSMIELFFISSLLSVKRQNK